MLFPLMLVVYFWNKTGFCLEFLSNVCSHSKIWGTHVYGNKTSAAVEFDIWRAENIVKLLKKVFHRSLR